MHLEKSGDFSHHLETKAKDIKNTIHFALHLCNSQIFNLVQVYSLLFSYIKHVLCLSGTRFISLKVYSSLPHLAAISTHPTSITVANLSWCLARPAHHLEAKMKQPPMLAAQLRCQRILGLICSVNLIELSISYLYYTISSILRPYQKWIDRSRTHSMNCVQALRCTTSESILSRQTPTQTLPWFKKKLHTKKRLPLYGNIHYFASYKSLLIHLSNVF